MKHKKDYVDLHRTTEQERDSIEHEVKISISFFPLFIIKEVSFHIYLDVLKLFLDLCCDSRGPCFNAFHEDGFCIMFSLLSLFINL